VLWPAGREVKGSPFRLTDEQFRELEAEGGVHFSAEHRQELDLLAELWTDDLIFRIGDRPSQFRTRLEQIDAALKQLEAVCCLDDRGETLDRHLVQWAANSGVEPAAGIGVILDALIAQTAEARTALAQLLDLLPPDEGKARAFGDARRFRKLAAIFESAGGKARAYSSAYDLSGFANTPFRRFAQAYYTMLEAPRKRTRIGVDKALKDALAPKKSRAARRRKHR
jgi:hypothetical protein